MEIEIAVRGGDSVALEELRGTLERHPAMRGVPVRPAATQGEPADDVRPGGMAAFEVINAVLSLAADYGALAVALYTALRNGRLAGTVGGQSSTVTVTRIGSSKSVTLSGDLNPEEIERLLRALGDDAGLERPASDS
ncbi:hypothetical protein [Streptomyces cyaneofuscatus]|uniref:effector-associated constant component EACC1 n=1 Tax=Streptomyces cyaneofuscatus TaxID=66883 RepID=UPI00365FA673